MLVIYLGHHADFGHTSVARHMVPLVTKSADSASHVRPDLPTCAFGLLTLECADLGRIGLRNASIRPGRIPEDTRTLSTKRAGLPVPERTSHDRSGEDLSKNSTRG